MPQIVREKTNTMVRELPISPIIRGTLLFLSTAMDRQTSEVRWYLVMKAQGTKGLPSIVAGP